MIENFQEFIDRVYTFDIRSWFIKNSKLSPYYCAGYGFRAIGHNKLECTCCKVQLAYQPEFNSEEETAAYTHNFQLLLGTSHKSECFFASEGHQRSGNRFKLRKSHIFEQWETFFEDNFSSYLVDDLDSKELTKLSIPLIDPEILDVVPKEYAEVFKVTEKNSHDVLAYKLLSIFGWKLRRLVEKQPETGEKGMLDEGISETSEARSQTVENAVVCNYLFCTFCGRQIPIKFFKTTTEASQNIIQNSYYSADSRMFHPLRNHRYFCLWGRTHPFGKKIYGWNICLNALYDRVRKGLGSVSFFDKRSEFSKLNLEIMKGVESMKKMEEDLNKKIISVNEITKKYNLKGNVEELKDKIQQRRQEYVDLLRETAEDIGSIEKKKLKLN